MYEHTTATNRMVGTGLLLVLLAVGVAACGSSSPKSSASSPAASTGNKTAFCNADIAINKASNSVTTMAGFLALLKGHQSDLSALKNDGPAPIRNQAQALVASAAKAIADNNPNELNTGSGGADGAAIDTYCGVSGSGSPLPSYFGMGKATALCSVNDQINQGTSTATDPSQVLSFLAAHQALVNEFASDLSNLPAMQKAEAQQLVNTARAAISSNNPAALGSSTVSNDSADVGLYCGHNQ